MKALKCLGCRSVVVVLDGTCGYCAKCNIALQEDHFLDQELKLEKDPPIKIIKKKKTKIKKTKKRKSKKKKC